MDHVDDAIEFAAASSFIDALWGGSLRKTKDGASGTLENGLHVGNRVGHVQGGLQIGFAARTACSALTEHWLLTSITASFVSPGEGKQLRARSTIVHRGRLTAVVRTQLYGKDRRLVLDVVSQHSSRRA
jgi:acyl-coenzyme A thioesterase PaaI-like protein